MSERSDEPAPKQLELSDQQPDRKPAKLTAEQRALLRKRIEPIIKQVAESELHIAYNLSALLLNARDTKGHCKEATVDAIIATGQLLGNAIRELVLVSLGESKKSNFLSTWLSIVILCSTVDEMLGDPHLVVIFKRRLKGCTDKTKMIALLDLLLCCGEEEHDSIVAELRKTKHLGVTFGVYWRVAMLYFFRFHRDKDRAALRKLLSDIRKLHRELPTLT